MENQKKHLVCTHLFNNYTGSPKILKQVIIGLLNKGYTIDLITNKTEGFLTNIEGVNYNYINYKWKRNKVLRFFYFGVAQLQLFYIILFQYRNKEIDLYINTLLPFGSALAGKIIKKKTIYHVHEFYLTNGILPRIYLYFYNKCVVKTIFVSNYLKSNFETKKESIVIYNSLDLEYCSQVDEYFKSDKYKKESILLVCSQRFYKGIYQFIKLSDLLPNYQFELVLSSNPKEVVEFCEKNAIPQNLKVYSNQTNLHPFYQKAKIVVNLSLPDSVVETFGLTILEAMLYGIPTIVPPVGGPIELVEDGFNGFLVDARNIDELKMKIEILMKDEKLYHQFSENALVKSKQFDYQEMINQIDEFIS